MMDTKKIADKTEDKVLLIINHQGANYKSVNEHVKGMNGFYNGVGWYVEYHHKEAISHLCQNASLRCLEFPLLANSFDELRKQHKTSYFQEKSIRTLVEIRRLRDVLNIKETDLENILNDEQYKVLEQLSEGRKLLELINEFLVLQKRIKQAEEEERLSTLSIDHSGPLRYLLEPAKEEVIAEEIKNVSPGIYVGYTIGEIDLKIPGGAISILAGPTSHGKTASLINFALGALQHSDQQDKCVYFFSYEESRAAIVSLFLNTYVNTQLSKNNRESIKSFFRQGDMQYIANDGETRRQFLLKKKEFFENLVNPGRLNVFYSEFSAQELVSAIRFLKKNTNVGLICIDYMQLLNLGHGTFGSRQEELKRVCLMLKDCAVDTGLPILLGAQFNRTVIAEADLNPISIGEAGDIERIANLIIGFWNRSFEGFSRVGNVDKKGRPVQKEPTMYFEILKGRETGAGQSEVLSFNGNTGKLINISKTSLNNIFG